jgi:hypothetical protein
MATTGRRMWQVSFFKFACRTLCNDFRAIEKEKWCATQRYLLHLVICFFERLCLRRQVFTRLKLAALCVRWSPCGRKLAIGSSEMRICISHQEKGEKWWVSKHFRRCVLHKKVF